VDYRGGLDAIIDTCFIFLLYRAAFLSEGSSPCLLQLKQLKKELNTVF
jgi:hypothetical protein